MKTNPFTPPKAELADQAKAPGSAFKAVFLGLVVDIGSTLLLGVTIAILYRVFLANTGMSATEVRQNMLSIAASSWISVIGALLGAAMSVLGGFVCARISRRSDYKLGFILGALSTGTSLLVSYASHSALVHAVLTCLTLAAVLLGTKLGIARNRTRPG